jgi:hypothetical protein
MAVRMMTEAETPGAVLDEYWTKQTGRDVWMVETHQGLVLELREMNGYDDSDFYARVWNDETGTVDRVTYASTRGWTYPNGAAVDATDEVKAKYDAFVAKELAEARAAAAAREAAMPAKGKKAKTVRNVRGKNAVEAGVTGTIFWVGEDKFSKSYYGAPVKLRVGFEADDGRKVFLASNAVEVVQEIAFDPS